jgi:hypothetical protein
MDIDPTQLAALERLAAAQGRTVAELFSDAIDQYILRDQAN